MPYLTEEMKADLRVLGMYPTEPVKRPMPPPPASDYEPMGTNWGNVFILVAATLIAVGAGVMAVVSGESESKRIRITEQRGDIRIIEVDGVQYVNTKNGITRHEVNAESDP